MNVVMLRYFNPVGSHKSGRIGEDPQVSLAGIKGRTAGKLTCCEDNNIMHS